LEGAIVKYYANIYPIKKSRSSKMSNKIMLDNCDNKSSVSLLRFSTNNFKEHNDSKKNPCGKLE